MASPFPVSFCFRPKLESQSTVAKQPVESSMEARKEWIGLLMFVGHESCWEPPQSKAIYL